MQVIHDFDTFYRSKIEGKLNTLESERKVIIQKNRKTINREIYILSGSLLLICLLIILVKNPLVKGFLGSILGIAYLSYLIGDISAMLKLNKETGKDFIKKYKEIVIRTMVSFFFKDLNYAPDKFIDEADFELSGIFPLIDYNTEYKGEDLIQGKIGETNIQFSDLHVFGQKIHTIFILKGIFFIADFNKNFKTSVHVLPDVGEKTGTGHLGNKSLNAHKYISKDNLVKLEDRQFEKEFAVYSADQVEARYVLTPMLMQKIRDLKQSARRPVRLVFNKPRIYIAIDPGKNLFEPAFNKPVTDYNHIKWNYFFPSLFAGVVEELDLNTRIWK